MNATSLIPNKWLRWATWLIGAVVALYALAWLAVPPLFRSQVQRIAGEQLGRTVTVGAVDFKPWTLKLTVEDVRIAKADAGGPQLVLPHLFLDGEIRSLFTLAAVADALVVQYPSLSVARLEDGGWDIDDVLARLSQPDASEPDPSSQPFPFSIGGIALVDGAVNIADRVVDRSHEVRNLTLRIPRLSSLASQSDVVATPRLSFKLNGVAVEASADSTPFADDPKTDATLAFEGLDLAPYLGYIPDSVPVELQGAVLDAALQIGMVQRPELALNISGTVAARDVDIDGPQGKPLLALDAVEVALADVRPLRQRVTLSSVAVDAPRVAVRRARDGQFNLDLPSSSTEQAVAEQDAPPQAWQVEIDKVSLSGGQAVFLDQGMEPAMQAHLRDLQLQASAIRLPFGDPLQFDGSALIVDGAPAGGRGRATAPIASAAPGDAATLEFSGEATDQSARVDLELGDLGLAIAGPYLQAFLVPTVSGTASLDAAVEWKAASAERAAQTTIDARRLLLRKLKLVNGKDALASVDQFEVTDARIGLADQRVELASVKLTNPMAQVERAADGRWMFERWLRGFAAASQQDPDPASPATDAQAATPPPAWSVQLAKLSLDGGAVSPATGPRPSRSTSTCRPSSWK